MVAPAFNTHSFSMNQRLLVLGNDKITALGKSRFKIEVRTPGSGNLAPAGFYFYLWSIKTFPTWEFGSSCSKEDERIL